MSTEQNAEKARRLLAQADHERGIARWAYGLRNSIRLGRPIKVSEMHQGGPFGRKREYLYKLDDRMPGEAVEGLYRALSVVEREAETRAADLEAQALTPPASPTPDAAA